jgi:hypothetical protein
MSPICHESCLLLQMRTRHVSYWLPAATTYANRNIPYHTNTYIHKQIHTHIHTCSHIYTNTYTPATHTHTYLQQRIMSPICRESCLLYVMNHVSYTNTYIRAPHTHTYLQQPHTPKITKTHNAQQQQKHMSPTHESCLLYITTKTHIHIHIHTCSNDTRQQKLMSPIHESCLLYMTPSI